MNTTTISFFIILGYLIFIVATIIKIRVFSDYIEFVETKHKEKFFLKANKIEKQFNEQLPGYSIKEIP